MLTLIGVSSVTVPVENTRRQHFLLHSVALQATRIVKLSFNIYFFLNCLTFWVKLKGQSHEMKIFLKALKSNQYFLYRRRWFLNSFASSMSRKVLFKFVLAAIKTLTNYGYFTGSRIRIPPPPHQD
jgi:hypothetical protein